MYENEGSDAVYVDDVVTSFGATIVTRQDSKASPPPTSGLSKMEEEMAEVERLRLEQLEKALLEKQAEDDKPK